jgi:hypothetical protein
MSKYHAGKHGAPLCGTRGHGNRYNVIVLAPKEWNELSEDQRCTKCAAKIQAEKAVRLAQKRG